MGILNQNSYSAIGYFAYPNANRMMLRSKLETLALCLEAYKCKFIRNSNTRDNSLVFLTDILNFIKNAHKNIISLF